MKQSAGLLVYRKNNEKLEVMLVHPGGPFWQKKDLGAWSIPKGEFESDDALQSAVREFKEETGFDAQGDFKELNPIRQSNKKVYAWAVEGNYDVLKIKSNTFLMEWPPHSGKKTEFPEIDKVAWFPLDEARTKIIKGQISLLEQLVNL